MAKTELHSEPLTPVDAAWLRMDSDTNNALIVGVMMFDQHLDFLRLRATLEYRLATVTRFHQRVRFSRNSSSQPNWEDDPYFDIDTHLQRIALPSPGGDPALQEFVSGLMSTPLNPNKPLWHMYYVENYNGGSAVVARLHHCIGDGISLVRVLLSITDDRPDAPWPEPPIVDERRSTRLGRLLMTPLALTGRGLKMTRRALEGSLAVVDDPGILVGLARRGVEAGMALGKLLLIPPDEKTILRGQCGGIKRASWSQPISLEEVKAIGRRYGATVNDVLISAVTGGVRRYLESRQQPVDGLNIRAVVPYSIRLDEDLNSLGNKFGLVFLSLPIGISNLVNRLKVVKLRMDQIKDTPEATVAFGILETIGMTSSQVEHIIVNIFAVKASGVVTNVIGPRQPIYIAGRMLKGMVFWVPQPGSIALGVSIFSYNSEVIVGVASDESVIPCPEEITAGIQQEFEELRLSVSTA